jgi:hypothetical protein
MPVSICTRARSTTLQTVCRVAMPDKTESRVTESRINGTLLYQEASVRYLSTD